MEQLQPIINLLAVLAVLSITAERITNLLKLRHQNLRERKKDDAGERGREYSITWRSALVGIVLAVLVKADFFEILIHLDNPWQTLGWVQVQDYHWYRAPATAGLGTFLYALGGCIVTGLGLGFGSKFWHDLLGSVFEMRRSLREKTNKAAYTEEA